MAPRFCASDLPFHVSVGASPRGPGTPAPGGSGRPPLCGASGEPLREGRPGGEADARAMVSGAPGPEGRRLTCTEPCILRNSTVYCSVRRFRTPMHGCTFVLYGSHALTLCLMTDCQIFLSCFSFLAICFISRFYGPQDLKHAPPEEAQPNELYCKPLK